MQFEFRPVPQTRSSGVNSELEAYSFLEVIKHKNLRVGLGQNGQILFISVEQLSLNVADDSAKTLSVLGNMG